MKQTQKEDFPQSNIAELAVRLGKSTSLMSRPRETQIFFRELQQKIKNIYGLYADLIKAVRSIRHMTHEVEYTLDNFYILEGAVEDVLNAFSGKEIKRLPQVEDREGGSKPRLYVVLSEFLRLTEARIGRDNLEEFILSYQQQAPLSVRELNMIPAVLRMILVDSAELLIKHSINSFKELQEAEYWFNEIMARARTGSESELAGVTMKLASRYGIVPVNLGFYLYERLRRSGAAVRPALKWLQLNFSKRGIDIKDLPDIENRERNEESFIMRNIMESLRWLNQTRWDDFARGINTIDKMLMRDPADSYRMMDQVSRDIYWKAVVKIADRTGAYEVEVVKLVLALSKSRAGEPLKNHVGYYLIDAGRRELEAELNYRPSLIEKIYRSVLRYPSRLYIGGSAFIASAITLVFLSLLRRIGIDTAWIFGLAFPVFIVGSDIAVNLMNAILTNLLPVKVLPKLDFRAGVPESSRTLVVIPSVFRGVGSINHLISRLEVLYLTGTSQNIFFGLLMDLKDAKFERTEEDARLIAAAMAGISRLNAKYPSPEPKFHLLARGRTWNQKEKRFMGWEKKRGILNELNSLLRGRPGKSDYFGTEKSIMALKSIKYVSTLDEDTEITREALQKLIGCISHPLNQPVMNEDGVSVARGYGIIQPRIIIRQRDANKSVFGRLFAMSVGIDSYSGPVADIYQDLFGNGIFFGKGIYDVDTLERSMSGQIPENTVLSHDLIEGIYAKVGFATDIQFFDGFPQSYAEYSSRLHRWTRGDWQNVRYLGGKYGKRLSFPDKWKISDNLRRSLVPSSSLILIFSSFWLRGGLPAVITAFTLIALSSPFAIAAIANLLRRTNLSWFDKTALSINQFFVSVFQIVIRSALLLYQGLVLVNAVLKSLIRVFLTKKHLLEWRSSTEISLRLRGGILEFIAAMWPASAVGAVILFYFWNTSPYAVFWGSVWMVSPLIAYWLSLRRSAEYEFSPRNLRFLRQTAYRTSRFFIDLSNESGNWLIPDHFHDEAKKNLIAERVTTSPTNLGCLLGGLFAARDFGYFGLKSCIARLERSLNAINALPRFKGHLYNWYDVKKMESVVPKYVSSVDSANFLVSATVLKNGLESIKDEPVFGPRNFNGFGDVLRELSQELQILKSGRSAKEFPEIGAILEELDAVRGDVDELSAEPADMTSISRLAVRINSLRTSFFTKIRSLGDKDHVFFGQILSLARDAERMANELNDDIESFSYSRPEDPKHIPTLRELSNNGFSNAATAMKQLDSLIALCRAFIDEADFDFLYNKERGLFHIGYNETFNKIDNSYYDFLASEANLVSFMAISKGQVPARHWFYLGRKMVRVKGRVALSSWGGSLFEYLTSNLYLNAPRGSLLDGTARTAIKAHRDYARKSKIPWGMGESAYNVQDINQMYQYQIFGVPDLGLKRGLKNYLVVAPYTVAMSLLWDARRALRNLKRLRREGAWKGFGFYDSVDYTDSAETKGSGVPVKIYYAHHQGFILAALSNVLNENRFRRLFHSDPMVASSEALLEEGVPTVSPPRSVQKVIELSSEHTRVEELSPEIKRYVSVKTPTPRYSFISNGRYNVCISNAGSGYSKSGNIFLTRFREDPVLETWGQFLYIGDRARNSVWSPTLEPIKSHSLKDKVVFMENGAEFKKTYGDVESFLRVSVSLDDVEIRELSLKNLSDGAKALDIASYGEPAMTRASDDRHHPAFQKMMIKSEFVKDLDALIFSRPHPSDRRHQIHFAHFMVAQKDNGSVSSLRRREDFLGRHGSVSSPIMFGGSAAPESMPIHNMDPIFSLRKEINLRPGAAAKIFFINAFSSDKDELVRTIRKYRNWKFVSGAIDGAYAAGSEALKKLGLTTRQALTFQDMASQILSGEGYRSLREAPKVGKAWINSLWRHGISGDLPILVLKVSDVEDIPVVKHMLLLHKYLKYKGLNVDVVFLNEYSMSYIKTLDDEIDFLIRSHRSEREDVRAGSAFHLKADLMDPFDREVIMFVSRFVFESKAGTLEQQIGARLHAPRRHFPKKFASKAKVMPERNIPKSNGENLAFWNGVGGFDVGKKEYVMLLGGERKTPVPWVNIVANKDFGFIMTESGSTSTWSEDSYDNRLTSWYNDFLLNRSGEIFYLRDEETGELWNPTPLPIKSKYEYKVSHGLGYSRFEHSRRGLQHEFSAYVPVDGKVKIFNLKIKNTGDRPRKLSLTGFFEMVLGVNREHTKRFLKFERDETSRALLVNNSFRSHFNDNFAYLDMMGGDFKISTDRDEFWGRHGRVESPDALKRESLSDEIRYVYDNCAALQSFFELQPGEEREMAVLLGEEGSIEGAREAIRRYRSPFERKAAMEKVGEFWSGLNHSIKLDSPDESLNILFNDWAIYQLVSSRMLGRTGYYQPSGAYGFRDQLQDSMALAMASPKTLRDMIIRAANHQFKEGDGENWWHDHNGYGIRTVFSDQQLWLAYVTAFYMEKTGDRSVLEEKTEFLEGPNVSFGDQPEWIGVFPWTAEKYSIYEHCIRAIDKTLAFGRNGLPLIGLRDWNDGFDMVGRGGKGESVWLAFFLTSVLRSFIPIVESYGDKERLAKYQSTLFLLQSSIDSSGWDGKWYRRAYFDSGIPLGSSGSAECRIDSIVQSWAVLSGSTDEAKARLAVNSAIEMLWKGGRMRLLTPPFTKEDPDPGYVRDNPPGVRENGGQYNHAALWMAQALLTLGDGDTAMEIIRSLNPILNSADASGMSRYRVEPYVIASDIYTEPNYEGRGGWTWYTGSAGLIYRTLLEYVVGLKFKGDVLTIAPCIPKEWKECKASYRFGNSTYSIKIENPDGLNAGVSMIGLDGKTVDPRGIKLIDDGGEHEIRVVLGR